MGNPEPCMYYVHLLIIYPFTMDWGRRMRRLNIILLYNLELGGRRKRMRRVNIILLYNLELEGG